MTSHTPEERTVELQLTVPHPNPDSGDMTIVIKGTIQKPPLPPDFMVAEGLADVAATMWLLTPGQLLEILGRMSEPMLHGYAIAIEKIGQGQDIEEHPESARRPH